MQLDPNYTSANGAKIKAGDQLGVYSYQTSTAQWKFEKNVNVTIENGKPVANFTTDHLTWYMVGAFQKSCTTATNISLDAPWMKDGFTYSLTVQAVVGGKVVNTMQVSVSNANKRVIMSNLPLAGGFVSIRVLSESGEVLTASGTTLPANACNVEQTVTLKEPASTLPKVTLQLYVRCPGDDLVLNVLPTFYLYYRETDETEFKLLGVVDNGFISTSALTPGAEYDFKAVWGENIKYANNKVVTADNSATVGTNPGDIIGEKDGANNLEMLTEACSTIK